MEYTDLTIEMTGESVVEGGRRLGRYRVRALEGMEPGEAVPVQWDERELEKALNALDARKLDKTALISLGRTLAALLLPVNEVRGKPSIRESFSRRLSATDGSGIRLRLRLPRDLAAIPWEYAYVEREGGDGIDGFLALDPRVAIVRHEALGELPPRRPLDGDLKIVAALASADSLPELDVDLELRDITAAVAGIGGVHLLPVPHATRDRVRQKLPGASIFHFAGHGDFTRVMGERPGTYAGAGFLAFEDDRVGPEDLAIELRGNGIRLAVLAGCKTGRREGVSVWSGVAPALVKAEIPAVVANQFAILDTSAVAFSRSFYQSLAGGLSVERAVAAGRIAIYSKDQSGRDWGVPVLYLRGAGGPLFTGARNLEERSRARNEAEATVEVRVGAVRSGGIVYGARLRHMLEGKLSVSVRTGDVAGKVVGLADDSFSGGHLDVRVTTDDVVAGGLVLGAEIRSPGPPRRSRSIGSPTTHAKAPPPKSNATRAEAVPRISGNGPTETVRGTNVAVQTGNVSNGTVIGTIQGNVTLYSGAKPADPTIEERIRLDVATPGVVVVAEPFIVVVAVKEPGSPLLAAPDLVQVKSADGSVFRTAENDIVEYQVEISGAGFTIEHPRHVFRLRANRSSAPISFQVTANKTGRTRSLFVCAYQLGRLEPELVAQTILTIEVQVAVQP